MSIEINPNNISHNIIVDGIGTCQHPNVIKSFEVLYDSYPDIKRIIEIGTLHGGFTTFLSKYSKFAGTEIITFDIVKSAHLENCDYRIKDCFENNGKEIIELINLPGRTLLLCDGGNKIKEFNFFADYLKIGDIIMAHDYIYSEEYCKDKEWRKLWGREIDYSTIKNQCEKNNLESILQNEIEVSFWCCFKKIK